MGLLEAVLGCLRSVLGFWRWSWAVFGRSGGGLGSKSGPWLMRDHDAERGQVCQGAVLEVILGRKETLPQEGERSGRQAAGQGRSSFEEW